MIKQMIISIGIVIAFSTLVLSLPNSRGMKEVVRLACGLFLILVCLNSIKTVNFNNFLDQYKPQKTKEAEAVAEDMLHQTIKNALLENLRNRAKGLGIDCSIDIVLNEDFVLKKVRVKSEQNVESFIKEIKKDYGVEVVKINE